MNEKTKIYWKSQEMILNGNWCGWMCCDRQCGVGTPRQKLAHIDCIKCAQIIIDAIISLRIKTGWIIAGSNQNCIDPIAINAQWGVNVWCQWKWANTKIQIMFQFSNMIRNIRIFWICQSDWMVKHIENWKRYIHLISVWFGFVSIFLLISNKIKFYHFFFFYHDCGFFLFSVFRVFFFS